MPQINGDMLTPYPTDLSEPSNVMLAAFRGNVPAPRAIHAAYQVAGVCLGMLVPDTKEAEQGGRSFAAGIQDAEESGVAEAAREGTRELKSSDATFAKQPPQGVKKGEPVTVKWDIHRPATDEEVVDILTQVAGEKKMRGPFDNLFVQQLLAIALQMIQKYLLKGVQTVA